MSGWSQGTCASNGVPPGLTRRTWIGPTERKNATNSTPLLNPREHVRPQGPGSIAATLRAIASSATSPERDACWGPIASPACGDVAIVIAALESAEDCARSGNGMCDRVAVPATSAAATSDALKPAAVLLRRGQGRVSDLGRGGRLASTHGAPASRRGELGGTLSLAERSNRGAGGTFASAVSTGFVPMMTSYG